jgi:hypothetical protein
MMDLPAMMAQQWKRAYRSSDRESDGSPPKRQYSVQSGTAQRKIKWMSNFYF